MASEKSVGTTTNGHRFGWARVAHERAWIAVMACGCGIHIEVTDDTAILPPGVAATIGADGRIYVRNGAKGEDMSESVLPACTGRYDAAHVRNWQTH